MTYTKPEVLFLGRAIDAVQMNNKVSGSVDGPSSHTSGAYEADE